MFGADELPIALLAQAKSLGHETSVTRTDRPEVKRDNLWIYKNPFTSPDNWLSTVPQMGGVTNYYIRSISR